MDSHPTAGPPAKMDPISRRRLQSFAFKLLLVIPVSLFLVAHRGIPLPRAAAFFCTWFGTFAGLAALVQRHRLGAISLTAWDEMAAFFGLALVARFLGSLVG